MDPCLPDQAPFGIYTDNGWQETKTMGEACYAYASNMVAFGDGTMSEVQFDPHTGICTVKAAGSVLITRAQELCAVPAIDFGALGITSGQMTFVFSWGVASVLGLWLLGYVIACGVQAINKA